MNEMQMANEIIEQFVKDKNTMIKKEVYKHKVLYSDLIRYSRAKEGHMSYVYFLLNKENNLVKIGATSNLMSRIRNHVNSYKSATGLNPNFELVSIIPCDRKEYKSIEKAIHKHFQSYLVFSEWFDISQDEILRDIGFVDIVNSVFIADCFDWVDEDESFDNFLKEDFNCEDVFKLFDLDIAYADLISYYKNEQKYICVKNPAKTLSINHGNPDMAKALSLIGDVKSYNSISLESLVKEELLKLTTLLDELRNI